MIEHFGFSSSPFTREISTKDHFKLDFIEDEVSSLTKVVEDRMSALLIAPAGTGKSTTIRALIARLPEARFRVHYVKVTELSKRDMCREIAASIGAEPASTYPVLVRSVQTALDRMYSLDCIRPVLILDEAHDLRPDVLSMIRLLTNFEMDSRLVVSIILAGQLPLKKKMYDPSLEDIRQRMAHCGELRLMSRDETIAYMKHRINIVGGTTFPFATDACEAVFEITRGNMRAIDHLSYKSLLIAAERKIKALDSNLVAEARGKLWT